MNRLWAILIIAYCLFPNTSQGADLGEVEINQKYKGADKALAIMAKFGVGGSNVKEVAYFVDERLDGSEFRIHEASTAGFTMKLHFDTEKVKLEGFKLRLTNEDLPNWEVNGNSEEVMLQYKIEW